MCQCRWGQHEITTEHRWFSLVYWFGCRYVCIADFGCSWCFMTRSCVRLFLAFGCGEIISCTYTIHLTIRWQYWDDPPSTVAFMKFRKDIPKIMNLKYGILLMFTLDTVARFILQVGPGLFPTHKAHGFRVPLAGTNHLSHWWPDYLSISRCVYFR